MLSKTIIIPCFNEKNTIEIIVHRVANEINSHNDNIIIIDDCSTDGTKEVLQKLKSEYQNLAIIFHDKNFGKGGALQTAFKQTLNEIIIIQDADLEYDPSDYEKLLKPFEKADADVVYGSRFIGGSSYVRIHFFWHYLANKILTFVCNAFANLNLSDMETGYKVFRKKCIEDIKFEQNSFGIEPEITLKFAKRKFKFFEVPISYNGRSYSEGKKIGLKDAFIALKTIILYSFKN